jgi:hypothetical protein
VGEPRDALRVRAALPDVGDAFRVAGLIDGPSSREHPRRQNRRIKPPFKELVSMRRLSLFAIALVPLLAATLAPQASSAGRTHPAPAEDRSGEHIVWSRFVDLDFSALRLEVSGPYGHHARMLTDPPDGAQDIDANVSPNGRRVAFERDLPDGSTQIIVVGIGDRVEHVLDLGCVDPCADDLTPTWTPDGRHLVFTRVVGPFPGGNATSAVLYILISAASTSSGCPSLASTASMRTIGPASHPRGTSSSLAFATCPSHRLPSE